MWLHRKMGTFRRVNQYLVLNEKSRDIFLASRLRLGTKQVVVKPNYVTDEDWQQQTIRKNRRRHFLFIGRLSPEKGIDVLITAFTNNGLPLTIIGDGPMRDKVKDLQEKNPLVRWMGYQPKEMINKELKQCTALIVPSVCLEGMPLTLVEAFALSTPAIASRLGGMASIVSHNSNGLLFTPNDASNLNEQLYHWVALTEDNKHGFGVAARQTYERRYTPEINFQMLDTIYRDIIMGRRESTLVNNIPYN